MTRVKWYASQYSLIFKELDADFDSMSMEIDGCLDHLEDPRSRASDMEDYLQVFTKLSRFYNRQDIKKLRLDLKKAIRSEWDRAVHQVMRMFDGACNLRQEDSSSKVMIGIGNSPVKGHAGPFVRYLISKLRSLGFNNIFSVEEEFTSQKCCHCGHQTEEVENMRYRIKKCLREGCQVYHHRDIMAGHNIANILEGYAAQGKRPNYLPCHSSALGKSLRDYL